MKAGGMSNATDALLRVAAALGLAAEGSLLFS